MSINLKEIEALCEAATPGPWEWNETIEMSSTIKPPTYKRPIIETDHGYYGPGSDDRAFIAASRTILPECALWIRRAVPHLQTLLDSMREGAGPIRGNLKWHETKDELKQLLKEVTEL